MKKKDKLPCELIQDLFPSYIDKLTSDVTNQLVEEHVSDCADCKACILLLLILERKYKMTPVMIPHPAETKAPESQELFSFTK